MIGKRNLMALLMAGALSVGTMGVAFAEDSGSDFRPMPYGTSAQEDSGSDFRPMPYGTSAQEDSGADFAPVPTNPGTRITGAGVWS